MSVINSLLPLGLEYCGYNLPISRNPTICTVSVTMPKVTTEPTLTDKFTTVLFNWLKEPIKSNTRKLTEAINEDGQDWTKELLEHVKTLDTATVISKFVTCFPALRQSVPVNLIIPSKFEYIYSKFIVVTVINSNGENIKASWDYTLDVPVERDVTRGPMRIKRYVIQIPINSCESIDGVEEFMKSLGKLNATEKYCMENNILPEQIKQDSLAPHMVVTTTVGQNVKCYVRQFIKEDDKNYKCTLGQHKMFCDYMRSSDKPTHFEIRYCGNINELREFTELYDQFEKNKVVLKTQEAEFKKDDQQEHAPTKKSDVPKAEPELSDVKHSAPVPKIEPKVEAPAPAPVPKVEPPKVEPIAEGYVDVPDPKRADLIKRRDELIKLLEGL